jgi:hypothetical protein
MTFFVSMPPLDEAGDEAPHCLRGDIFEKGSLVAFTQEEARANARRQITD